MWLHLTSMKKGPTIYVICNYLEFRVKLSLFVEFVNEFSSPNDDSHRSTDDNCIYYFTRQYESSFV